MIAGKDTVMTKNQLKPLHLIAAAIALLAIFGSLPGCGDLKTNPMQDYPELTDSVRPHGQKPRVQSYIDSAVFQIETEKNLVFFQGREERFYFKPRLLISGVTYELKATGLPDGAKFGRATERERAGQYVLAWSPSASFLTDQEFERTVGFQLALKVVGVPDAKAAEVLTKISTEREFELRVVRSREQPVVEKLELPVREIQEGDALAFSVIVRDLGAGDRPPRLLVDDERGASRESAKIDGAQLVKVMPQPEILGGGRFKFAARFDTKSAVLPGTQPVVPARFVLVIVSRSGLPGVEEVVEIRVIRKPTPAPSATASVDPSSSPSLKPAARTLAGGTKR